MPAQIRGFREAARALRRLASQAPRLVAPALATALEPVRDEMLAEMPRDTGTMASSVEILTHAGRRGRASAEVRVRTDYAFHVDEGTEGHPADHFAEQAIEANQRKCIEIATREIGKALDHG